jgi:diguanylate cyclase (GGDEF)-like protein/PAS domain S-box-containing protein
LVTVCDSAVIDVGGGRVILPWDALGEGARQAEVRERPCPHSARVRSAERGIDRGKPVIRRHLFWVAGTLAVVTGVAMVFVLARWPSTAVTAWIDDAGEAVSPLLIAAPLCVWAARRTSGTRRCGWLLLGGSALVWGIGECVYTYLFDVVQPCANNPAVCPNPSYADLFFLAAIPIGIAGLLLLPGKPRSGADLLRQVLDGLLIGCSVLYISWAFALKDLYNYTTGSGLTRVATAVGLAYPIGDVIMVTLAISAFSRIRRGRLSPVLLMIGFLALAVSDTAYNYYSNVVAVSDSVSPTDAGWYFGYFLVGLAALWVVLHPDEAAVGAGLRGPTVLQTVAPYVPLAGVAVATVYAVHLREWGAVLAWDGVAIIVALLDRQLLALVENLRLNRGLESRVAEGTRQFVEGQDQLRASQDRFRSLVQNSTDVITIIDASSGITFQTESVESVLGYPSGSLLAASFLDLVKPGDRSAFEAAISALREPAPVPGQVSPYLALECHLRDHSGGWRYVEIRATALLDNPAIDGIVLNVRDITDRKTLEDQLTHQTFHDVLTRLPNRALFRERLEYELARNPRDQQSVAVFVLDIDAFSAINDSLSHEAGDSLLIKIAERLSTVIRPGDTLARLGGDEFAVLSEGIAAGMQTEAVAGRLSNALVAPFDVDGTAVHLKASMGIAIRGDGDESADDLLRSADLAMYRAKERNTGGYEMYEPSLHSQVSSRFALQSGLQTALEREELVLHYQPLVALATGRAEGFEALLRWVRPEQGIVMPLDFIPIAEQTGLIVPIGRWVLRTAAQQAQNWREEMERDVHISVNLSPRQLRDPGLSQDVHDALRDSGLPPRCLTLEVTESMLIEDVEGVIGILSGLRELGVHLSLDDFGTGYSSFSYLREIPVTEIKIDRSFVSGITRDRSSTVLARSIIGLAESLGLDVVAEGIEQLVQCEELRRLGCRLGQGYYFAAAQPPDQAVTWVTSTPDLARLKAV